MKGSLLRKKKTSITGPEQCHILALVLRCHLVALVAHLTSFNLRWNLLFAALQIVQLYFYQYICIHYTEHIPTHCFMLHIIEIITEDKCTQWI